MSNFKHLIVSPEAHRIAKREAEKRGQLMSHFVSNLIKQHAKGQ